MINGSPFVQLAYWKACPAEYSKIFSELVFALKKMRGRVIKKKRHSFLGVSFFCFNYNLSEKTGG